MVCKRVVHPWPSAQMWVAGALWGRGLLLALVGSASAWAGTVALATGEYPPFVSEQLPEGGVTAVIVRAAFKTQGFDTQYAFLPWKRGMLETASSKFAGTFPYLKTPERETEFLYSRPIYADRFRMFVRKTAGLPVRWNQKLLCIPLGYDTTQVQSFVQEHQMRLAQPPEINHCFKMLQVGRVDAVWVSQLVGWATRNQLFGKNSGIEAMDLNLVGSTDYFLIVSRKYPDAQSWLDRFNAGLKRIKDDGTYQRIVTRFHADGIAE